MNSIPGIGAIIKNNKSQVFMVYVSRRGMKRWELPTRMVTNGESLFLSLYRCVEDESSFKIIPKIKKPVCYALNTSKKNALSFFGIFFECSFETNKVKKSEHLLDYPRRDIPRNLKQELIDASFKDWRNINIRDIHPQHLNILQILDQESETPFFTIISDADREHEFYNNNTIELNPIILGINNMVKIPNITLQQKPTSIIDVKKHAFEVGLSFPGEIRNEVILPLVNKLKELMGDHKVFYDNHYVAQLAVPNLDSLLQDIYKRSKLIVVFLCEKYAEKEWCGLELRVVRELIMKKQDHKLMFIRTDYGQVEGIFKIDGSLYFHSYTIDEITMFIQERVHLNKLKNEG